MLRLYSDVRDWQSDARRLYSQIVGHDRSLADQLRRSAQSVALNVGEGMGACGGVRRNCYRIALREARECGVAIETAQAWGYVGDVEASVLDRLDKIRATLFRLTSPKS